MTSSHTVSDKYEGFPDTLLP